MLVTYDHSISGTDSLPASGVINSLTECIMRRPIRAGIHIVINNIKDDIPHANSFSYWIGT